MNKTLLVFISLLLSAFQLQAQGTELTNRMDIAFAYDLIDWQGNPVDSLRMDVYYPPGATSNKKYPAILMLHGGSFLAGSRSNVSDACDLFADEGFISIASSYRVGYDNGGGVKCAGDTVSLNKAMYRGIQDVDAAFRYIIAHADDLKIDTSALFIGGASAGGNLALNASYVNDSVAGLMFPGFANEMGLIRTSGNVYRGSYTLKGICAMWGAMPSRPLISSNYRAIPTILFKGGKDKSLPDGYGFSSNCKNYPGILSGKGIYDALRNLGVPSVYHFQPVGSHSSHENVFCAKTTGCFFRGLINKTPYSGFYTYYTPSCP